MRELWSLLLQSPEAMVAFLALVVSCVAIFQGARSLRIQREHNYHSLRPLPSLNRLTYVNRIGVQLENRGLGPMLLQAIRVHKSTEEADSKTSLIEWMPSLPPDMAWSDYRRGMGGSVLQPDKIWNLVLLEGDPDSELFAAVAQSVRRALAPLIVTIRYRDIYDREYVLSESLSAFDE